MSESKLPGNRFSPSFNKTINEPCSLNLKGSENPIEPNKWRYSSMENSHNTSISARPLTDVYQQKSQSSSHINKSQSEPTASFVSSSGTLPAEVDESLTFAINQLPNGSTMSFTNLYNEDIDGEEFTAQFEPRVMNSEAHNFSTNNTRESKFPQSIPEQLKATTPEINSSSTTINNNKLNEENTSIEILLKGGWKSFAKNLQVQQIRGQQKELSEKFVKISSCSMESTGQRIIDDFRSLSPISANRLTTINQNFMKSNFKDLSRPTPISKMEEKNNLNSTYEKASMLPLRQVSAAIKENQPNKELISDKVESRIIESFEKKSFVTSFKEFLKVHKTSNINYHPPPCHLGSNLIAPIISTAHQTSTITANDLNRISEKQPLNLDTITTNMQKLNNSNLEVSINKETLINSPPTKTQSKVKEIIGLATAGRVIRPRNLNHITNSAQHFATKNPAIVFSPQYNPFKKSKCIPNTTSSNIFKNSPNDSSNIAQLEKSSSLKGMHLISELPVISEYPEIDTEPKINQQERREIEFENINNSKTSVEWLKAQMNQFQSVMKSNQDLRLKDGKAIFTKDYKIKDKKEESEIQEVSNLETQNEDQRNISSIYRREEERKYEKREEKINSPLQSGGQTEEENKESEEQDDEVNQGYKEKASQYSKSEAENQGHEEEDSNYDYEDNESEAYENKNGHEGQRDNKFHQINRHHREQYMKDNTVKKTQGTDFEINYVIQAKKELQIKETRSNKKESEEEEDNEEEGIDEELEDIQNVNQEQNLRYKKHDRLVLQKESFVFQEDQVEKYNKYKGSNDLVSKCKFGLNKENQGSLAQLGINNYVSSLKERFNEAESKVWNLKAREWMFNKDLRLMKATIKALDERIDYFFDLIEDKSYKKDFVLSLTSSELNQIFSDQT